MNKDTLYGKIKFHLKSNAVAFKYKGNKVIFNAATINNFGIHRKGITRVFKAIVNDWKNDVFVEVLTEGKIDLYLYDTSGNELYEDDDYDYRYYISYYKSSQQKKYLVRVTPRSYKSILKQRLKNQPNLVLENITYEDVPEIIAAYNH